MLGAPLVLRIEDLDHLRTRPGSIERMLEDLSWLGLQWDEGPENGPFGPYQQSRRAEHYQRALETLRSLGLAYPCTCSRREVATASQAPHGAEPVYPGTCAQKDPEEVLRNAAKEHRGLAWRFRSASVPVSFVDGVFGPQVENVATSVGDFVIFRADGVAAYQLAVVVDDIAMRISHVVRGADLLASTARQVLLYRALGGQVPEFSHVGLVVDDDGNRLAKRDGGLSIAALRTRGISPTELMDSLARSLNAESPTDRGWILTSSLCRSVTLSELGRGITNW